MDKSIRATSGAVSQSQNWTVLEFLFTGSAVGTASVLAPAQQIAGGKVHLLAGDAAGDLLTAAQASVLVSPNSGQISAAQQVVADKLVIWGTNVPAAADAARCVAFVVGGLGGLGEVLAVELEHALAPAASASAGVIRTRVLGAAVIKLSSDTLVYGTDNLVFFPEADVLAGNFLLAESANSPIVGAEIKLRVYVRL